MLLKAYGFSNAVSEVDLARERQASNSGSFVERFELLFVINIPWLSGNQISRSELDYPFCKQRTTELPLSTRD